MRAKIRGNEQGVGLIEVLVAVAIISLAGGAFISALGTSTRVSAANNERTMAESLAQAQMEDIMQSEYDGVSNPPQYTELDPLPANYGISIAAQRLDVNGDGDTSVDEGCQKITVQVSHHGSLVTTVEAYKAKHD